MSLTRQERRTLAALEQQFSSSQSSVHELYFMPWPSIRTHTSWAQEVLLISTVILLFIGGLVANSPTICVLALTIGAAGILALALRFLVWLNTNAASIDDRQPENH